LKTRINEHVKNITSDESKYSVITKLHILDKNHTFDWQNVKILDFKNNYFKRLIEMIYIKTQDNGLNLIDDIECLDSYFNLLSKMFNQKQ